MLQVRTTPAAAVSTLVPRPSRDAGQAVAARDRALVAVRCHRRASRSQRPSARFRLRPGGAGVPAGALPAWMPAELRRIPASGRLLIVANHPSGALDALALLDAGRAGAPRREDHRQRPAVGAGSRCRACCCRCASSAASPARTACARSMTALREEQCVIVFPAGEVARLGLRGVTDGRWRRGFLRFARATDTPVLPVRIEARNSALFYGASAMFKPAGTALLAREMFARRARRIALRIGHAAAAARRWRAGANCCGRCGASCISLGTRRRAARAGCGSSRQPLIDAIDPATGARRHRGHGPAGPDLRRQADPRRPPAMPARRCCAKSAACAS